MVNTCVYLGKTIAANNMTFTIDLLQTDDVDCSYGVIGANTNFVFRSR